MTYEIITPDTKNLYFNVEFKYHLEDTTENRYKVHIIRELIDDLKQNLIKKND